MVLLDNDRRSMVLPRQGGGIPWCNGNKEMGWNGGMGQRVCVCVCVCVRERDREVEKQTKRGTHWLGGRTEARTEAGYS